VDCGDSKLSEGELNMTSRRLVLPSIAIPCALAVFLWSGDVHPAQAPVEGLDCGCSLTGSYLDPDEGRMPFVRTDGLSPGGVYRLTALGTDPIELTITRVDTGATVLRLSVSGNSAWGFSPDDHRFVYHYVLAPTHYVSLHNLEASNPLLPVRTFAVATSESRIIFSPRGQHLLYAVVPFPFFTDLYVVDARTGTERHHANFTFQSPPQTPADRFGLFGWGFGPDLTDRTLVYAYVTGQSSVELRLINLSGDMVYSEAILSWAAFWQFSRCGDLFGLVNQPGASQVSIRPFRTIDGRRLWSPYETFPLADVALSSTVESQIATVGGTGYVLTPNGASATCAPPTTLDSLTISPTTVRGSLSSAGAVMLTGAAPPGGLPIALSSNDPGALVPPSVTVPQGRTRASFTISTRPVATTTIATITAAQGIVTSTARLTIIPVQSSVCGATPSVAWQMNTPGEADALAVDGLGNVVAGGFTSSGTSIAFAVLKLDGLSSAVLWSQSLTDKTFQSFNDVNAVAMDPAGDVVAAGLMHGELGLDFAVAKFDGSSGAVLWRQQIYGNHPAHNNFAMAVTIGGTGDVVAGGYINNMVTDRDFAVVKFDGATGEELWRQVIGTVNRSEIALSVAVDGMGNVFAAGATAYSDRARAGFTVIKFDGSTGAELWRHAIYGVANDSSVATTLVVDGRGNVVAGGSIFEENGFNHNHGLIVLNLNGIDGTELWRRVIYGSASGFEYDRVDGIALDGAGDVVAAGYLKNEATNEDFAVAKFDGVSGAELWRQVINGTANGDDEARGVAVDGAGNVLAAGFTQNTDTGRNFTLLKLNGLSGAVSWCRAINRTTHDIANAVAVDGAGNVVAAGYTVGIDGSVFTVIKLRGTDGGDL
jgi:hypothetical protein